MAISIAFVCLFFTSLAIWYHVPPGKKDVWPKDAFETILDNLFLDFKAISSWNENWGQEEDLFATLKTDSSAESLETFRKYSANPRFTSSALFSEAD